MAPNLPLSLRDAGPTQCTVPWVHWSPQPKRHLDWFSRFCRADGCDQQTDRQTDTEAHTQTTHHTTRVTIQEVIRYEKLFQHALIADIKPAQSNARNQTKKVEKRKKTKK